MSIEAEAAAGDREASLWEHLSELAIRLRRIVIAFFTAALVLSAIPAGRGELLYAPLATKLPMLIFQHTVPPVIEAFDGKIYRVLPLPNSSFESISILAQSIMLLGLIGASPIIAKEIWEYVEPALYPHEKAFAKRYIVLFVASFIFGVFFGIYIVAPLIEMMVLKLYPLYIPDQYKNAPVGFFTSPAPQAAGGLTIVVALLPLGLVALRALGPLAPAAGGAGAAAAAASEKFASIPISVSVSEVVSFALKLGLAFGALFELPIVLYLLLAYGILDPDLFNKNTMKYIFLGTMILGAIISPDPSGMGMLIIGLSLYLPMHVAITLGKKRALKRKIVEEMEAIARS